MIPWILISIIIALILLGLLIIFAIKQSKNKNKQEPDYYAFFILGIVWVGAGLPMAINFNNWGLFAMGLIFMFLGLANKDKWKTNHKTWKQLNKKEKRIKIWLLISGVIILVLGAVAFFLVQKGII